MSTDIHKAAGILIKDKKFLVVRSKGEKVFYSPGGKIESGETSEEALIRELKEELTVDVLKDELESFGTFTALAATDDTRKVHMEVFLVKNWKGELSVSNEIEELAWIDSNPPKEMEIGSIFHHEVLPRLKERNLID